MREKSRSKARKAQDGRWKAYTESDGTSEKMERMNVMESETNRPCKMRRWPKRVAIAVAAVIVVGCTGFFAYMGDYYHANETVSEYSAAWTNDTSGKTNGHADGASDNADTNAAADLASIIASQEGDARTVTETDSSIALGSASSEYGLIFYPGGKVEAAAYIPLMEKLADRGIYCIVAKMPFNFAFFNANAADALMGAAPAIKHWWIGGHSLGGVVASSYAAGHTDALEGIVLLAAYSTDDLSDSGLDAVVLYGSNDQVVNRDNLAKCEGNLPNASQTVVVEGGNHAGFGDYGAQAGDGEATISADEQQTIAADAIAKAMKQ